jgi:hypothetical protein
MLAQLVWRHRISAILLLWSAQLQNVTAGLLAIFPQKARNSEAASGPLAAFLLQITAKTAGRAVTAPTGWARDCLVAPLLAMTVNRAVIASDAKQSRGNGPAATCSLQPLIHRLIELGGVLSRGVRRAPYRNSRGCGGATENQWRCRATVEAAAGTRSVGRIGGAGFLRCGAAAAQQAEAGKRGPDQSERGRFRDCHAIQCECGVERPGSQYVRADPKPVGVEIGVPGP